MQEPKGTEVVVVNKETGEIIEQSEPAALKLNTRAIAIIVENVALAEKLVTSVLEPNVDYGRTPGTPQDSLWDAGASKIMAAFNCYPQHDVIYHQETDDLISWTIQVKLTNRKTQEVIGTGMGACSTREPKYRYRWVVDPDNYGYTEAEIADLKYRSEDKKYRIENPEYGELIHNLLTMACKRAEVDATKSLPGVGSSLKKLFDPKLRGGLEVAPTTAPAGEPDFKRFWGIVKGMGVNETQAHKILGVVSLKDWIAVGHSLDDALMTIGKFLTDLVKKAAEPHPPAAKAGTAAAPNPAEKRLGGQEKGSKTETIAIDQLTAKHLANPDQLEHYAKMYFNMEPTDIYKQLGYQDRKNFEEARVQTSWDAFLILKELNVKPGKIEPEELPF